VDTGETRQAGPDEAPNGCGLAQWCSAPCTSQGNRAGGTHNAAGVAAVGVPRPPHPAVNRFMLAVLRIAVVVHVLDQRIHLLHGNKHRPSVACALQSGRSPSGMCSHAALMLRAMRMRPGVHQLDVKAMVSHRQLKPHAAGLYAAIAAVAHPAAELTKHHRELLAGTARAIALHTQKAGNFE
jgi:hypothetical protein